MAQYIQINHKKFNFTIIFSEVKFVTGTTALNTLHLYG
jgi:hypothetical protein